MPSRSTDTAKCIRGRVAGILKAIAFRSSCPLTLRQQLIHDRACRLSSFWPVSHEEVTTGHPHGIACSLTGIQTESSVGVRVRNSGPPPNGRWWTIENRTSHPTQNLAGRNGSDERGQGMESRITHNTVLTIDTTGSTIRVGVHLNREDKCFVKADDDENCVL